MSVMGDAVDCRSIEGSETTMHRAIRVRDEFFAVARQPRVAIGGSTLCLLLAIDLIAAALMGRLL